MKKAIHTKYKIVFKTIAILLMVPLLLMIALFTAICLGWIGNMPTLRELDNPQRNLASEVYSDDGKIMGSYYIENRDNTEFKELPSCLTHALIAREDHRFYQHSGIDAWGLLRVLCKTVLMGK